MAACIPKCLCALDACVLYHATTCLISYVVCIMATYLHARHARNAVCCATTCYPWLHASLPPVLDAVCCTPPPPELLCSVVHHSYLHADLDAVCCAPRHHMLSMAACILIPTGPTASGMCCASCPHTTATATTCCVCNGCAGPYILHACHATVCATPPPELLAACIPSP